MFFFRDPYFFSTIHMFFSTIHIFFYDPYVFSTIDMFFSTIHMFFSTMIFFSTIHMFFLWFICFFDNPYFFLRSICFLPSSYVIRHNEFCSDRVWLSRSRIAYIIFPRTPRPTQVSRLCMMMRRRSPHSSSVHRLNNMIFVPIESCRW